MCASEIHRPLKKIILGKGLQEYLYVLIEMVKPILPDEQSVIEYFVKGIPDFCTNNSMMYQARRLKELIERTQVYEKVKEPHLSQNMLSIQQNIGRSKYDSHVQQMRTTGYKIRN